RRRGRPGGARSRRPAGLGRRGRGPRRPGGADPHAGRALVVAGGAGERRAGARRRRGGRARTLPVPALRGVGDGDRPDPLRRPPRYAVARSVVPPHANPPARGGGRNQRRVGGRTWLAWSTRRIRSWRVPSLARSR